MSCRAEAPGSNDWFGGTGFSPAFACMKCSGQHTGCEVKCFRRIHSCTAEWTPRRGGFRQIYPGREKGNRNDAQESALSACRGDHWSDASLGRCRITACTPGEQLIEKQTCVNVR